MADITAPPPSPFTGAARPEAGGARPRPVGAPAARTAGAVKAGLTTEILPLSALAAIAAPWRDLLARAAEPNPFYGPDFLLSLTRHVLPGRRGFAAVIWADEGGSRRMAAFLPFQARSRLPGFAAPVLQVLAHPFIGAVTPLVAADDPDGAMTALLDALARTFPESHLALDGMGLDGPVHGALARWAGDGRAIVVARAWERAAVGAGLSSEHYLAERVSSKRLRELRRCERLLRAEGELAFATLSGPAAAGAVRAFLRLEEAGWKGRQRTALASRPATLDFACDALVAAPEGLVADVMTLDDAPIAVALHLVAGGRAMAFKCAYDEAWSRASPGALLDLHSLRMVLDGGGVSLMDSNALPGHPVESLWRERLRFGHVLVALDGAWPQPRLDAHARRTQRLADWGTRARAAAKRLLGRKSTALRVQAE